jgi:DNA ligase-1
MRRFVQLFDELDATTQTARKEAALERYFSTAEPTEAAWVLFFLLGRRLRRPVPLPTLRSWVATEAGLPLWLVEQCCDYVGDQGEALALLLPAPAEPRQVPLAKLIEERILPLRDMEEGARRSVVVQTCRELGPRERFLYFKLLGGSFRVGVAEGLVARALARVAGLSPAVMAHRLMGDWQPSSEWFGRLLSAKEHGLSEAGKPYPFLLASPLTNAPATLGPCDDWQVEWKWDGIRAQVLHRHGEVLIWSRGEELLTDRFPEVAQAVASLPTGTVLDGEILAWTDEAPLPFALLQKRISRKRVEARWQREVPCVFLAFDLLEEQGLDLRGEPLALRRARLEKLLSHRPRAQLRLGPILSVSDWSAVAEARANARNHGVEGVMLKRRSAAYAAGQVRGIWWKWKLEPRTVDAVLLSGQLGRGRRADLHTDYTFGVWDGQQLVPIAKAYSGLSDAEIRQVDRFIKANTISQHGPVRWVRPELVFEIAFEGIQWSSRHRAGLALRFPRINRWRTDKTPEQADRLDALRAMLPPKPVSAATHEAEEGGLFAHIIPDSSS